MNETLTLSSKDRASMRRKIFRALIQSQDSNTVELSCIVFDEPINIREIKHRPDHKLNKYLQWLLIDEEKSGSVIYEDNSMDFQHIITLKTVKFTDSFFYLNLHLSYSFFKESISFNSTRFQGNVNFMYCEFSNVFDFARTNVILNLNFFSSQFKERATFIKCSVGGWTNLFLVQFYLDAQFRGVTFDGEVILRSTGFYQLADFRQSTFRNIVYFNGANIKQKIDFSQSVFFERLMLHGLRYTDNSLFCFDYCSIKSGNLEYAPAIPSKYLETRRTAQLFKHTAIHNNDQISMIDYNVREMELYNEALKWSTRKDIANKIILFFNEKSNKFGSKWVRGVSFTLIFALFFFVLMLFLGSDSDTRSLGVWVKGFVGTVNVLNFSEDFAGQQGVKLNALGVVLAFISKIFVSYGIYQTVSAFRKHGK